MADTYKTALDKAYKRVIDGDGHMYVLKDKEGGHYAVDELGLATDDVLRHKTHILEIIKYWGE